MTNSGDSPTIKSKKSLNRFSNGTSAGIAPSIAKANSSESASSSDNARDINRALQGNKKLCQNLENKNPEERNKPFFLTIGGEGKTIPEPPLIEPAYEEPPPAEPAYEEPPPVEAAPVEPEPASALGSGAEAL